MTAAEWEIIANRISDFWTPAMTQGARGAYFDRLGQFSFEEVKTAVDALADTTVAKGRPTVGAIRDVILARGTQPRPASSDPDPVPERDVLDSAQHRVALLEIGKSQTPEHKRRVAAVLATGKRFTLDQLRQLLPEKACPPDEFDRRLAAWAPLAPTAFLPEPAPRQRRLLSTDPEDCE